MRFTGLLVVCVALVWGLFLGNVAAATYTWNGGGGADTSWTNPANWNQTTAYPGLDDAVTFPNLSVVSTVTVPAGGVTVASVTFSNVNGGHYVLTGGELNVSGNYVVSAVNVWDTNFTVGCAVAIGGSLQGNYYDWPDYRMDFTANSNSITGGINTTWGDFLFSGAGNTIGGGITVQGYGAADWLGSDYGGVASGYTAGDVMFTGAGNIISGALNLNRAGSVYFNGVGADLSNVTAFNFNGGALILNALGTSTTPAFTLPTGLTNLNVASGTLWLNSYAISSTPSITLGGANTTGALTVSATTALPNNIILAGNGGFLTNTGTMTLSGNISDAAGAAGWLFKAGSGGTTLTGTNTYSGGTVIASGNLTVSSGSSLGTGDVIVGPMVASLTLNSAGNLGPDAAVTVLASGAGYGGVFYSGQIFMNTDTFMPNIDPSSDGLFMFSATVNNGSALANSLSAAPPGNGKMWIGTNNSAYYYGTNLAPGLPDTPGGDYVYRLAADWSGNNSLVFQGSGVLFHDYVDPDTEAVTYSDVYLYDGSLFIRGPVNTFHGTLTIRDTVFGSTDSTTNWGPGTPLGYYGRALASGSSFGDPSGNVVLIGGVLGLENGGASALPAVKNDLSISGGNFLMLFGDNATDPVEFDFASLTRANRGTLIVDAYAAYGLGVGSPQKVKFASGLSNDANGMLPAYVVSANGYSTGNFLTYDSTDGLTNIPFVPFSGSETAGTAVAQAATATTVTTSYVEALRADAPLTGGTVTLQSGGLILTQNAAVNTTNFQAGASGGQEMFLFANNPNADWGNFIVLQDTITAAGLTCSGPGTVRFDSTVDNTTTLVGDIYVNAGALGITGSSTDVNSATSITSADKELGASTNKVILNGGMLVGGGVQTIIHHQILIGPAGGTLGGNTGGSQALTIYGAIGDLDPNNPGVLYYSDSTNVLYAVNTFSGTSIFSNATRVEGSGYLGTGPIIIAPGGNLGVLSHTGDLDASSSDVTIQGTGLLWLCDEGAEIGSLSGAGVVQFGSSSSGGNRDLIVGGTGKSTDWYGQIYETAPATGVVTKVGDGTLTIWSDVNWHGATTINGGTLAFNGHFGGGTKADAAVTVNSTGTLAGTGTVATSVIVNTGGTLAGSLHITGAVAVIDGTVNMTGAELDSGLGLVGSATGSTASMTDSIIAGAVSVDGTSSYTGGGATINGNVTTAGAFGGANTINGNVTMTSGGFSGTNAISGTVTSNGNFSGSNTIGGAVDVQGGTFSGTNTVNNTFTLDAGVVSGMSSFNGNVTLNGGSFTGNNTVNGSFTTAPGSNAIVAPHNGATAGTLTINGNVALDNSTTLDFNLGTPGTIGGGINDLIDITGSLTLDGTLNVTGLTGFAAGTYTLFTYTGLLTEPSGPLTLGTMPSGMGYTYTIDTTTLHQVNLDVVMPYPPGDVNHDGVINSLDIDAIYHNFGAPATSQWKVDGDGNVVGQGDVTYELHTYFHTNYGDANLDTKTDFSDFQVLLDHWQVSGPTIGWAQGDFNGSYSVDFLDFQTLLDYWNPGGWSFAPAQTPEPATLTLLALGGLALLRRRK